MNVSPTTNALNLMAGAQHKVNDAAQKIAALPVQQDEVGSPNYQSTDLIKPVLSLNEAKLENSAGAKILQTQNQMLGRLLDVKA